MRLPFLRRLARDERGVTLVEFAMIVPVLCVLLLGIFELGYRSYAQSVVQGALHEAARMATVGGVTVDDIDARVRTRLSNFDDRGEVAVEASSYFEYSGVGTPETITTDTAPEGEYNEGDCWIDSNGNGEWDADRGAETMGGAEDIVRYRVSVTLEEIVPIAGLLGWDRFNTIRGETVLRNQPFAARNTEISVPTCPEEEA
jgi:Flp pilus assembly pilin Flp